MVVPYAIVHQWQLYMFKVLMSVWVKMLGSYSSQLVRTSCELTRTLSVRQRSAENTEKKKRKKNRSVAEKKGKYLSWLKRGSKQSSFSCPPHAFSVRNWSKSMSFHVQAIPDQAGMHPVLIFSPTVLALKRPEPPHTHIQQIWRSEWESQQFSKMAAHRSGCSA